VGERRIFGVSHVSHPKRAEFQRSPILGVLLYLCLHPLTQNDEIRHGNTYGEGHVLGGQPRHCIRTKASRGLSATAEFLVYCYKCYEAMLLLVDLVYCQRRSHTLLVLNPRHSYGSIQSQQLR